MVDTSLTTVEEAPVLVADDLLVIREHYRIDGRLTDDLYAVHLDSFGLLRDQSAMRYVYTRDEWNRFMVDPRIIKMVAYLDGEPVAMNTGATDLAAVPWLSPEFCSERFPGRTVFYQFDTMVGSRARGTRVVQALYEAGLEFSRRNGVIVVFSVSQWGIDRHFIELIQRAVERGVGATVGEIDAHRYYAFDAATPDRGDTAWVPPVPAVKPRTRAGFRDLAPGILRQRLVVEGTCSETIDADQICDYLSQLSSVLNMSTLLPPVTHQSPTYGWAGWIHWESSGAHFYAWDDPIFFSVDIYTCLAFDAETAVEFTRRFFDANEIVSLPIK